MTRFMVKSRNLLNIWNITKYLTFFMLIFKYLHLLSCTMKNNLNSASNVLLIKNKTLLINKLTNALSFGKYHIFLRCI